ncbi:hypothetical protein VFPPC_16705 [Pochonia chlamydosporia 170]|uniref:Uncharacterized protein n=1 Tax=Pochonia chlamydosporia 170 TaxID=1380566 RepID=A0A179F6U1_METCM|nr:hypothetical protein VFPPC_16705 [Pochonia chlamydosporia 170]OAQ61117.1 hypothetical protein VFPPC_16705 [Pochonia chlamydosporia 170]
MPLQSLFAAPPNPNAGMISTIRSGAQTGAYLQMALRRAAIEMFSRLWSMGASTWAPRNRDSSESNHGETRDVTEPEKKASPGAIMAGKVKDANIVTMSLGVNKA